MDRLTIAELEAVRRDATRPTWPSVGIIAVLKKGFHGHVDYLGDVDDFCVYGVDDRGLNFVVALSHLPKKRSLVCEIALLASFADYDFTPQIVDAINPKLHIAEAVLDGSELYLAARIEPAGKFNSGAFAVQIATWRADLVATQRIVSAEQKIKRGAVISARTRTLPAPEARGGLESREVLRSAFAKACRACLGRGRVGLFRRICETCEGAGEAPRHSGH